MNCEVDQRFHVSKLGDLSPPFRCAASSANKLMDCEGWLVSVVRLLYCNRIGTLAGMFRLIVVVESLPSHH